MYKVKIIYSNIMIIQQQNLISFTLLTNKLAARHNLYIGANGILIKGFSFG